MHPQPSDIPPSLVLKSLDKNNRSLFTSTSHKPWSTVLQCEPICTAVSLANRHKYCSNCLMEREVSRCGQCRVPYYCSKECQREDWKGHKMECAGLKGLGERQGQGEGKIDVGAIGMEILINLRLWVLRQKDQEVERKVGEMCHLIEFQTPEKLAQFQETAVALISVLGLQRNEHNLGQLVKQQSAVSLNSFTIQDYLCSQQSLGVGLYWPGNFLNHHCHPNTSQIFDGRTLKIVAIRPISPNQQLTISYMPTIEGRSGRQKVCREGYLFECFCEECQVGRMLEKQEEVRWMKCPFCGECGVRNNRGKGNKPTEEEDEEDEQKEGKMEESKPNFQCTICKKQISVQQIAQIIDKANKCLQTIRSQSSSYQQSKKSLLALRKLNSLRDPRMKGCLQQVYTLSLQQSSTNSPSTYPQSYILLKQMVELVPYWYRLNPEDEIPYPWVWRYAELGKLAYWLEKYKKACLYTEKAYDIVEKIGFKNRFGEVEELRKRYQEMRVGLSFNKAEIFKKG